MIAIIAFRRIKMHGWLLLDKPRKISSAGALGVLKKYLRLIGLKSVKVGHAGTLDPAASGLLIVALGQATKLIQYVMDSRKEYDFTIRWGEDRDTLDEEGKVVRASDIRPSAEAISSVLERFKGEIYQVPPQFSALKIEGKRAYELARQGTQLDLPARKVVAYDVIFTDHSTESSSFKVICGKGFYVRALARDIATSVGACGYVESLRRTASKNFHIADAISLDKIEKLLHNAHLVGPGDFLSENLKPVISVLDDILVQDLDEASAIILRTGAALKIKASFPEGSSIAALSGSKIIAMCEFCEGWLKPKRVFNY